MSFSLVPPRVWQTWQYRGIVTTADHGPCVSGAHNTIVAARAGKDLVSSLISGLATIGTAVLNSSTFLLGFDGGSGWEWLKMAQGNRGPAFFLWICFTILGHHLFGCSTVQPFSGKQRPFRRSSK